MQSRLTTLRLPSLWLAGSLLALITGCAGKSGGGDSSSAAPPALNTVVTGSSIKGTEVTVHYRSDQATARFKCQLTQTGHEDPAQWQDCPTDSITLTLVPGRAYTFLVKAYDPASNAEAGQASFPLSLPGAAPDHGPPAAAAPGSAPPAAPGAPSSARPPAARSPTPAPKPLVETFQLGDFYSYTLPNDVHVTEYSTNKTPNGQLEFYRIAPQSDPFYLGNYACGDTFDATLSALAPDHTSFDYCQTTPPTDELVKQLTGFGIANNHLEVATNPRAVTPEHHDYIDFNVFDADFEYMRGRTRFEQLCASRSGAIYITPLIRFIKPDFYNGKVKANLFICNTQLVEPTGAGLPPRDPTLWRNAWWVGAFFVTRDTLALPQPECLTAGSVEQLDVLSTSADGYESYGPPRPYAPNPTVCGIYQNPSLLEVTFVTNTPYPSPEDFAFQVVKSIKGRAFLNQITPVGAN